MLRWNRCKLSSRSKNSKSPSNPAESARRLKMNIPFNYRATSPHHQSMNPRFPGAVYPSRWACGKKKEVRPPFQGKLLKLWNCGSPRIPQNHMPLKKKRYNLQKKQDCRCFRLRSGSLACDSATNIPTRDWFDKPSQTMSVYCQRSLSTSERQRVNMSERVQHRMSQ